MEQLTTYKSTLLQIYCRVWCWSPLH